MSENKLQLKLVTPVDTIFEQDVDQVILPTEVGQITVLPNHTALVSILEPGELVVKDGEKEFPLVIAGGVIEISDNHLVILADSAEEPGEIDLAAAEERAKELAAELEQQEQMDITTYTLLQKQLAQEQARLQVGKKWRK